MVVLSGVGGWGVVLAPSKSWEWATPASQNHPMKGGKPACCFQKCQGSRQLVNAGFASGRKRVHHHDGLYIWV